MSIALNGEAESCQEESMMTAKATRSGDLGQTRLLSIFMTGRDDDYMPDFHYRITTTINHLARSLKRLDRMEEVEILVTDWGSHVPLAESLALSPEATELCRFIYVSPELIRTTQGGSENFHTTRALNVALRRAGGRFLFMTGADQLILQHSLEAILRLLNGDLGLPLDVSRVLMMVPRRQVPWQFVAKEPDLEEWDRYLLMHEYSLQPEPVPTQNVFGAAGGFVLHGDLYQQFRGFDERFDSWGWSDIDFGLRVSQHYPFLWLSSIGVMMYHLGHPPTGRRVSAVARPNPQIFNSAFAANSEQWGFSERELEISPSSRNCARRTTEEPSSNPPDFNSQGFAERLERMPVDQTGGEVLNHLKCAVRSAVRRGRAIDAPAVEALFLLAWYSHRFLPKNCLEFPAGKEPWASLVSKICPSVEVYEVHEWQGLQPSGSPLRVASLLEEAGSRGYVRFVNGNISTAVKRLGDSFLGPFSFDLIMVQGCPTGIDPIEHLSNLIHILSSGGALIFTSDTEETFDAVWHGLQRLSPGFTCFLTNNRKTGMLLARPLQSSEGRKPRVVEVKLDTSWLAPLRFKTRVMKKVRNLFAFIVSEVEHIWGKY